MFSTPSIIALVISILGAAVVFQLLLQIPVPGMPVDKTSIRPMTIAQQRFMNNNLALKSDIPCVSAMNRTKYRFLNSLARRYDQTPFHHLVLPRLRFHFDERFAPESESRDSSAMIMLFMYPPEEDWGQNELIDASFKVWFGPNAANVATIDIAAVKSLDEVRQSIFQIIEECPYTIIRFKNAELKRTSDIIRVLQDVRSLSFRGRELDGSKAIYFFEYGIYKNHIHREDFSRLVGQYRNATGDQWHKYFDTVELVQKISHMLSNSTFDLMLGSRMRVSVIPFLPIPQASIKKYLEETSFKILDASTVFPQEEYLKLIGEQNPGIKAYKYMDDTDCNISPLSLPCLRAKCNSITCSHKIIQFAGNSATCTCT